jgi:hypothetical protein
MKKTILIILASVSVLTVEFIFGYKLGVIEGDKSAREKANQRAVDMILNDEIPNYYMVVGTVDYLINNKSGDLEKALKEKQDKSKK